MSVEQVDTTSAVRFRPEGPGPLGPAVIDGALDSVADRGGSWCRCGTTSIFAPEDDTVVLRVAGVLDLATCALLQTALSCVLEQEPDHLIVDVAGLGSAASVA